MATVLVAVLVATASIWIAIRMEPGLDTPTTRARGSAYPVRPAHCRFQDGAANPVVNRPPRCADSALIHGVRRRGCPAACPASAGRAALRSFRSSAA
jgi:hypothetical protein